MTASAQALHRAKRWLFVLFIGSIVLAGCSRSDQTGDAASTSADTPTTEGTDSSQPEAEADPAPTGAPIDNAAFAVIVTAEQGGDTLSTEVLEAQALNYEQQVQARQPGVTFGEAERQQVRKGIAEEFIRRTLLVAEAARLGLTADPTRIDTGIDQLIAQSGLSDRAALEQVMAEQGVTMDSLRSFIEEEVILQMIQEQIVGTAVSPTGAEIEAFSRNQGKEVWAQHILLTVPDPAQDDAVRQKATTLLDSAKTGTDFFALARRHSEGPSGPSGGDLGYFARRDMIPEFSEAAFALADSGDVYPELVQTSFGYHIIRKLGERDAAPMDTTQARVELMRDRQREAYEKRFNALRAAAVIRINEQILGADFTVGLGS